MKASKPAYSLELTTRLRRQEHLARVGMIFLAKHFGEDSHDASQLVADRDFDRLKIRVLNYGDRGCRRAKDPVFYVAIRCVWRFIREQAPVTPPKMSQPDRQPPVIRRAPNRQRAIIT
ncbi:MAG TPA: hypothetical protein VLF21_01200 [Candidatus Saccharimonadales bacterium]|nr:hypothetical protein [Candidatus Saccharimonadales bacterium]